LIISSITIRARLIGFTRCFVSVTESGVTLSRQLVSLKRSIGDLTTDI